MMIFCCPACGSALEREDRALRCANGHSYDIARQGYVHLLPVKQMHAKIPGDTKQMVDARRVFLSGGYYDAFRDKLARTALFWTQAAVRAFTLRLYMKKPKRKTVRFPAWTSRNSR